MKKMTRILVLSLVSIIGLSAVALGGTISKTFEIGEGTSQPYSHKRTFEIPCNLAVRALVSFSRPGRPGIESDVPLTITLMQPSADGGEGEVVASKQIRATTNLNSITLDGEISRFGCQKTWSVRVKADESSSNFTVRGEIRLTFNDDDRDLSFTGDYGSFISHGESKDFIIYFRNHINKANSQGIINLRGEWYHNFGVMPIKMRAELVNPRGEVVAFDEGYPQNEVNPCCSGQKLRIRYRLSEYIEGDWKIRLKNLTTHDAARVKPIGNFKPSCP